MSGRKSRSKGARRELELAALLPGAVKVSGMYKTGHDVEWLGRPIEVKARADGFKFDYRHLRDVEILAKRADRQEWLVTMRIPTLLDLLEGTGPTITFCFEHGSADVKVRQHGALSCPQYRPDDPCSIGDGRVVPVTPTIQHRPDDEGRR